jgi:large subunit ribosomal protein L22
VSAKCGEQSRKRKEQENRFMEARAITKYVRISPYKARHITRLIQGKPVPEALGLLDVVPRKAARLVAKTLRSAVANAANHENNPAEEGDLVVKEAVIGEAATMKRYRPKARGMAGRIRKRTSHIRITVTDEPEQ